ncbi:Histidine kinase [Dyadobacter soli]|uniref:Histidine kinase n=1 Tax=Dyadobacter soli TaxID=659014 RepID=A0A1G7Y0Z1_9BACT|nr:histidine kinase [Dyadobacter soli]SDG90152.1 Histidine kinase [Dyadobacter soli]
MKIFSVPGLASVLNVSGKAGNFCRKAIFSVLLGFSLFSYAHAVGPRLQITDISLPRQFKDRNIKQAVYDSKGLLWFFTNRDIYRFDGNNVIGLGPQFGIQPYTIKFIHCDDHDRLWIGTRQMLIRLDLKTWKHHSFQFPTAANDADNAGATGYVMQTRAGRVLVAAGWGKLYEVKADSLRQIFDLKDKINDGPRKGAVNWIHEQADGDLWLTTGYVARIVRLHPENNRYVLKEVIKQNDFTDKSIQHPVYHESGKILFLTDRGELKLLDCHSKVIENVRLPHPVRCAYQTPLSRHQVLITTIENELFIFDFKNSSITTAGTQSIIAGKRIPEHNNYNLSQLIVYESGQERGIFRVALAPDKPGIEAIDLTRGNSIRSIYKHPSGDVFLGTYSEGFLKIDGRTGAKKQLTNLLFVYKIVPWSADTLLLGIEGGGLYWYDIPKGTFSQTITKYGQLYEKYVTSIVRTGNLAWVGCYQGFYLADLKKGQIIESNGNNAEFAARQVHVSALYIQDGMLWVCTVDGLFVFEYGKDGVGKIVYRSDDQTSCTSLAFVGDRVYAATIGKGLVVLDRRSFKKVAWIDETKNLAGSLVYSISFRKNVLLAGTNNGLSRIDLQTGLIRNYKENDGLPSNEFNTGASFLSGDTLLLGTVSGVVVIPIDKLLASGPKAPGTLYVTQLLTQTRDNDRKADLTLPYHSGTEIVIPADVISFTVHLGGDISGTTDETPYFFRLDKEMAWSRLGNNKEISLVRPQPGSYRLEVGTAAPNGKVNAIVTAEMIRIKPQFSETAWFKILLITAALALGMAVFRYLERQREKERGLRLKIAEDLHDEVGGLISGLALQADFLQYADDSQRKEYLRKIIDTGRMAVKSMHDVVWSIDPRNDNAKTLTERMKDYAEFALKPVGIQYGFESEGITELTFLSQQVRQNMWLIYKEAITNVCKHSQAGKAQITLDFNDSQWRMCITDNGRGLGDISSQGNGLKNMQNRAHKIRAELKIESGDRGVTVTLAKKQSGVELPVWVGKHTQHPA